MQGLKVTPEEARKFASVWSQNGIVIPMQDCHIQFAADFANVVLTSFIAMAQQNAAIAMKNAQEEAAPKIAIVEA